MNPLYGWDNEYKCPLLKQKARKQYWTHNAEERFGDGHPEDGLATPGDDGQAPIWMSTVSGDVMPIGRRQYVETQMAQAAERGDAPPFFRALGTELLAHTIFRKKAASEDNQITMACLEIKDLQATAQVTAAGHNRCH